MGNKTHDLKKLKLEVKLTVEVELDRVVDWDESGSNDKDVLEFILSQGLYNVADHLAEDLVQDHIIEDGMYDRIYFNVNKSKVDDVYFTKE